MLILDQLKRTDRQLHWISLGILAGFGILLAGLWYVQVVSAPRYRADWRDQSLRLVRVPAIRGKILDRNGIPLAENRPCYNVSLYLEELRKRFTFEYTNRVKPEFVRAHPDQKLTDQILNRLQREARYRVVSNYLAEVAEPLKEGRALSEKEFNRYYLEKRTFPFPLLTDLTPEQLARFVEKASHIPSVDLEIQAVRVYPYNTLAAHVIGHLQRDDNPDEEDAEYRTPFPDFKGVKGLEAAFDEQLRGRSGVKSVLVNSLQYRQSEEIIQPAEPGMNLVTTLDLVIQQATERALSRAAGPNTRGAAVVMDVVTGDILAMASSPTFDPNHFVGRISQDLWTKLNDEELRPMFNRAAYGLYPPGSVFKIIVALAGLEAGTLDPDELFYSMGYFQIGRGRPIGDTAGAGFFDFNRAFYLSSNPYFIAQGTNVGYAKLVEMGRRFGLGAPTGLTPPYEAEGYLPDPERRTKRDGSRWTLGDTGNLSIGQGDITVTPLQVAVMTAAIANGGVLLKPRIAMRLVPQERSPHAQPIHFPARQIQERVRINPRHLQQVREAMLQDVENPEGTGRTAAVPGMRIAGKTGTAQVAVPGQRERRRITWFASFAPYEDPRYAVVVVVEDGLSGTRTCAPVAGAVYRAILKREKDAAAPSGSLAQAD